jgi:hypothetical protein
MTVNTDKIKAYNNEASGSIIPLSVEGTVAFTHEGNPKEFPNNTHFYVEGDEQEGFKAAVFNGDIEIISGSLSLENEEASKLLLEGDVEVDGNLTVLGNLDTAIANLYMIDNTTETILDSNQFEEISGSMQANTIINNFELISSENSLKYTGENKRIFIVNALFSSTVEENSIIGLGFGIAKNNSSISPQTDVITESISYIVGKGTAVDNAVFNSSQIITELEKNDKIYCLAKNDPNNNSTLLLKVIYVNLIINSIN